MRARIAKRWQEAAMQLQRQRVSQVREPVRQGVAQPAEEVSPVRQLHEMFGNRELMAFLGMGGPETPASPGNAAPPPDDEPVRGAAPPQDDEAVPDVADAALLEEWRQFFAKRGAVVALG
jgi:hypothetical protein